MRDSFYSTGELRELGLGKVGRNVKISRKCSIYSTEEIRIGDSVRIDDFSILSGSIDLGSNIHIAAYCGLYGNLGITIEDYASISARVLIYSASDDFSGKYMTNPTIPTEFTNVSGGRVIIRRHSIVGAGTIILPGVTLGEGCAVGAASVVNRTLEGWRIYSGTPCRCVSERSKDLLELASQFEKKLLSISQ